MRTDGQKREREKRDTVVAEACTSRAFSIAFRACVCVRVRVWSRERDESYRYVVCEVRLRVVRARGSTERSTMMWRERSDRVLFVVCGAARPCKEKKRLTGATIIRT